MNIRILALEAESEKQLSALEKYLTTAWPKVIDFGLTLLFAVLVFFVGTRLIRLIRKVMRSAFNRHEVDIGVAQFLDALIKYLLYFILFLVILGQFGIQATSILAIAGSAGLTLGLALQGSLSNFAGGVLILLLKPFRVGDYISEDSHKNEGTVIRIQLFYTTLKTIDGKQVTIPNATLANTSLSNASAETERMLALKVSVAYDTDLAKARETLLAIFADDVRVLNEPQPYVIVSELADSAIILELRGFTAPEDYWPVRWDSLEKIVERFREDQIMIPYPQLDVHTETIK